MVFRKIVRVSMGILKKTGRGAGEEAAAARGKSESATAAG
jgi:hypothetical protein